MTPIRLVKETKKGFNRSVDSSVELHFDFYFQQNAYGGWGRWLKDTGRGPQESPSSRGIADIARDQKDKGKNDRGSNRINAEQEAGDRKRQNIQPRKDTKERGRLRKSAVELVCDPSSLIANRG